MRTSILYIAILSALSSCVGQNCSGSDTTQKPQAHSNLHPSDTVAVHHKNTTQTRLEVMGLVNIKDMDPSIVVKIVYATDENFTGEVLYNDLTEAYLLPEAAIKLTNAQNILRQSNPGYSIIVYDAARPMSIQRKMREIAVRTGKQYYVANPANGGGLHNYGAAVDVSILDENGIPLSMGTAYDHLGSESNTDKEKELTEAGIISEKELDNRLLLRRIMRKSGFSTVTSEWWHFNHCSRKEAKKRYALINF